MNRSEDIPELVEQFLYERGGNPCWITVQDIRGRFGLNRNQARIISVFLKRLAYRPGLEFPFIVNRIERARGQYPSETTAFRYLVRRR
jgi:hypothetical protein